MIQNKSFIFVIFSLLVIILIGNFTYRQYSKDLDRVFSKLDNQDFELKIISGSENNGALVEKVNQNYHILYGNPYSGNLRYDSEVYIINNKRYREIGENKFIEDGFISNEPIFTGLMASLDSVDNYDLNIQPSNKSKGMKEYSVPHKSDRNLNFKIYIERYSNLPLRMEDYNGNTYLFDYKIKSKKEIEPIKLPSDAFLVSPEDLDMQFYKSQIEIMNINGKSVTTINEYIDSLSLESDKKEELFKILR